MVASSISLLLSVTTFIYTQLRRGTLLFWKPHVHVLSRAEHGKANLIIGIPVNVTNTGAVVHSVNFMDARLGVDHYFVMQTEVDSLLPTRGERLATSFAVPPRSSCSKLVIFASWDPQANIKAGEYQFGLHAYVDGGRKPKQPNMVFDLTITEDAIETISRGGQVIDLAHYVDQSDLG